MFSKTLVKSILCSAALLTASGALAAPLEEAITFTSSGDMTVSEGQPTLETAGNSLSLMATASSLPAAWTDYIQFNMQSRTFLNHTFECRIAIMYSSNTDGYYQLYNHRAEGFTTFKNPPAKKNKSGGSTQVGPITSIGCDQTPPGISY